MTNTLNSSDITHIDLKPGLRHPLSITLGMGILFLSHQTADQRVLTIPPSELCVASFRFGMGSCGLPWVMDI